MKSLKGYSPEYIKEFISKQLDIPVEDIRLFGSRIDGTYDSESDLDIAIFHECPEGKELLGFSLGDLELELHWTGSFEYSWLQNSI